MHTLAASPGAIASRSSRGVVLYGSLAMALAIAMACSVMLGLKIYSPSEVWRAFVAFDGSETSVVIVNLRLPRAIIAPLTGAGLGVAGVIIQTLARNRIASPDTLGLNAGASLAVVVASFWLGVSSLAGLSLAAAVGALLTSLLVFGIAAGAGGLSPLRIVLVGVTMAGLGHALVEIILTSNEAALEQLLFWLSGAIVDRPISLAVNGGVMLVIGAALGWVLAPSLDALQADDATASGLGVPLGLVRGASFIAIALLTGSAITMAGPVGFVGLVIPHAARALAGLRHRHQIAAAALLGAIYVTVADIAVRYVIYPAEAPVGAVTAAVGGVVLLGLLKRRAA